MGTKNSPGRFDCYSSAEPDEPMFVLLARDERAPWTVIDWVLLRAEPLEYPRIDYQGLNADGVRDALRKEGKLDAKAEEALQCAEAMERWRLANDGRSAGPSGVDPCPPFTLPRREDGAVSNGVGQAWALIEIEINSIRKENGRRKAEAEDAANSIEELAVQVRGHERVIARIESLLNTIKKGG